MELVSEGKAKGRRAFFGKALGGFLAAVGLGKVAPGLTFHRNAFADTVPMPPVSCAKRGCPVHVWHDHVEVPEKLFLRGPAFEWTQADRMVGMLK